MTKSQTTTGNSSQRLFLVPFITLLSVLTLGCSEDSGQQEISQKIEQQEINVISDESSETTDEVLKTISTSSSTNPSKDIIQELPPKQGETLLNKNLLENEKDKTTNDVITKKLSDETESIEKQLNQLQGSLSNKNKENSILRQHMEILLKKVQENQNIIEKFETQDTQQK